ncbi:MAG: hypothetical protein DMF94_01715 [Acidobacteria bacterium]|nr:MAG: hypothetical protein DMF94_01715 [Acidobacteriota bacterium]
MGHRLFVTHAAQGFDLPQRPLIPGNGTGLYYNRARYYSPQLQRFVSEDPSGSRA